MGIHSQWIHGGLQVSRIQSLVDHIPASHAPSQQVLTQGRNIHAGKIHLHKNLKKKKFFRIASEILSFILFSPNNGKVKEFSVSV